MFPLVAPVRPLCLHCAPRSVQSVPAVRHCGHLKCLRQSNFRCSSFRFACFNRILPLRANICIPLLSNSCTHTHTHTQTHAQTERDNEETKTPRHTKKGNYYCQAIAGPGSHTRKCKARWLTWKRRCPSPADSWSSGSANARASSSFQIFERPTNFMHWMYLAPGLGRDLLRSPKRGGPKKGARKEELPALLQGPWMGPRARCLDGF